MKYNEIQSIEHILEIIHLDTLDQLLYYKSKSTAGTVWQSRQIYR